MMLKDWLSSSKAKQLPFVLFSKPHAKQLVGVFQSNYNHYTTTDFTEAGFVFAPFYGKEATVIPQEYATVIVEDYVLQTPSETQNKDAMFQEKGALEKFEDLVRRGIRAIEAGAFDKVVLSRKEYLAFNTEDVFLLFTRLKDNYPTAFCSLFYHPAVGMWMGATPEQLLNVTQNKVTTMALAGTQKNLGQLNVTWGEKEQEEQQYVTDFITASLEPFTVDLKVSEPFTARAAKVMHICTAIEATLRPEATLKPILSAIHPTPAVCGMPKEASRDFILKEEGYNRAYYAGFLGALNWDITSEGAGETDLFVNLRCMELEKDRVALFVGCGITKDSVPYDEFVETENKSTTMKKILK